MKKEKLLEWGLVLLGVVLFVVATAQRRHYLAPTMELLVAPSIPVQLAASFGDRYLAANVAVWRTLMTGGQHLSRDTLAALSRIQEDASFLNPGHEDNYVTATALLPWEGFVEPGQVILRRAVEARKTDFYAPFFYGFNEIHFLRDGKEAYRYGRIAAERAPPGPDREALTVISAAWLERGNDAVLAKRVIELLAAELKDPQLKAHLQQRAMRQGIIQDLQQVVDSYVARHGKAPRTLDQLVVEGWVERIPPDPLGSVLFTISEGGHVGFIPKPRKQ